MAFFGFGKKDAKSDEKILRVGLLVPLDSLDPHSAQDTESNQILAQVYEQPYRVREDDGSTMPLAFSAPLRRESDLVVSAPLRGGMKFSDGTPITAQLVVDSFHRSEALVAMATMRADGERVVFELREPNSRFDLVLTQGLAAIVLERDGKLLGSGPFRFPDSIDPEDVRLSRNPHYRRELFLDGVEFVVYRRDEDGGKSRLIQAIEAGEVDVTTALARDDVGPLKDVTKTFLPGASTTWLFFNTKRPHFQSGAVRRALASAIDRSELTKICYDNALAFTATGLLPPMMGSASDGLRFNPEQAKAKLAELGVELPPELVMHMVWGPRPYLPHPRRVAKAIVEQLGAIGVRARFEQPAGAKGYFDRIVSGDYDMVLGGWVADTPDPVDYLESQLSSKRIPEAGKASTVSANMGHWSDPRADEALEALRREASSFARRNLLDLLAEEVPLFPIMYGPSITISSRRVKNLVPSASGYPSYADVDLGD